VLQAQCRLVVGALAVLFAVMGAPAGSAQTSSVDWKLFGAVTVNEDREFCFYEAKGVVHSTVSHIRVWAKCLPQKDIDAVDIEKDFDGKILKNTAQKVARYYAPPIAAVEAVDADAAMFITEYEEIADLANIPPRASIYYELNCSDRMLRELSIHVQADGKTGSRDKPSDWKYVPPEGNAANLLKILCPTR
jgi:malate synthase